MGKYKNNADEDEEIENKSIMGGTFTILNRMRNVEQKPESFYDYGGIDKTSKIRLLVIAGIIVITIIGYIGTCLWW